MSNYNRYEVWKDWSPTDFGALNRESKLYFDGEFRTCGFPVVEGLKTIELGFGNGSFAAWATSHGSEYTGTESIPSLVARAGECGYRAFSSNTHISEIAKPSTIDLIAAFDVIEHLSVSEFSSMLKDIFLALRPGGYFVFRVPSGDSPFGRAIQHGDMTHKLILGSSAVRQLALENGFDVNAIREPFYPVRGLGAFSFLRRGAIVCVRAVAYPILAKIFMGDGAVVLSPNMLCVLEKPLRQAAS